MVDEQIRVGKKYTCTYNSKTLWALIKIAFILITNQKRRNPDYCQSIFHVLHPAVTDVEAGEGFDKKRPSDISYVNH
jgi:hypothetical protein